MDYISLMWRVDFCVPGPTPLKVSLIITKSVPHRIGPQNESTKIARAYIRAKKEIKDKWKKEKKRKC